MAGKSCVFRIAAAATMAFFCSASARAESTLNFPRLSFEEGVLTGIAIVNPSDDEDATVTITAYGQDGQPLAGTGIKNPAEVPVLAGQQVAMLASELFGEGPDPATVAWFQATSSVDDLTGFFLFQDSQFTLLDGADLPAAEREIVFTQVRLGVLESTELNIVNPGEAAAELQIQLIRPDALPISKLLWLAAKGVIRIAAAAFFGVTEAEPGAYVKVSSTADVAGFEIVRSAEADPVGLNARSAAEQLTHLYFPQLAVLGPFETVLGVVNNSTQAVILTITAFRPDGSKYDTQDLKNNPVTRSLDAGEALAEDAEAMFGFSGEELREGWLQVEATSEAVTGFVTYGVPTTGSTATVAPSLGRTRAIFSHIATIDDFYTGVAILNAGQLAANVRVVAVEPSGDGLGSFSTVLQPGHRISKLIHQLIPGAAGQNGGLIWVSSDLPVYLTSLFGSTRILANIPPQASPANYVPDAGLSVMRVLPPLSIVQPSKDQIFSVEDSTEPVSWQVNGVEGGDPATVGIISNTGSNTAVYVAPSEVPTPRVVTVTADSGTQIAGASVDILEKSALFTSDRVIQSVAYLGTLEKIYTAELQILGGAGSPFALQSFGPAQDGFNTELFEAVGPGLKNLLIPFNGEKIAKMIPYRAGSGKEFLLLAAQTTGRIIRLDPETLDTFDVATELNQPTALVIDATNGSLLVAEKDRVSQIPREQLEAGLVSPAAAEEQFYPQALLTGFLAEGAEGIAVDRCTGNIYISDGVSEVRQYLAREQVLRSFFINLDAPGPLLGFYRNGVGCPESFHMLVVEQGTGTISLLSPTRGSLTPWTSAPGSTDLEWISGAKQFVNGAAVLIPGLNEGQTTQQDGRYSLTRVELPELYRIKPSNPEEKALVPELPVPAPLSPKSGDLIKQNVSMSACPSDPIRGFGFRLSFDWEDSSAAAGIAGYELIVQHAGARNPLLAEFVESSEFQENRCNAVVTDEKRKGWGWRVRAKDKLGNFSEWSQTESFQFAPCMLSGGQSCLDVSDLSLVKRASTKVVDAGERLRYTLEVTNHGPSRARKVRLVDRLPLQVIFFSFESSTGKCSESDGIVVCELADLDREEKASVTIEVEVRRSAAGALLMNSAQVRAAQDDPDPSNNDAQNAVFVQNGTTTESDLVLTMKASAPEVEPGGRLHYTLSVVNRGPADATEVSLRDELPAGTTFLGAKSSHGKCEASKFGMVTCLLGTLRAGEPATVEIDVAVNVADTLLINSAFVKGSQDDPQPLNNSASVQTRVEGLPAVESDLSLTKEGSVDPVAPGGTLTYSLVVSNKGPGTASQVILVDELPEETTLLSSDSTQGLCVSLGQIVTCKLGVLEAGAQASVTLDVNVSSLAGGNTLANSATVKAAEVDPETSNNQAEAKTTVGVARTILAADLSLTKTDSPDPVLPGDLLTYTLTVKNAGPSSATDVVLTDTLPPAVTFILAKPSQGICSALGSPVTCKLGTIGGGAAVEVAITVSVDSEAAGTTIINSAEVGASEEDPNLDNNVADESTVVKPEADLSLTKTVSTTKLILLEPFSYIFTVTNAGPNPATEVTLIDKLPDALGFLGGSEGCAFLNQTVTCSLDPLEAGSKKRIEIEVSLLKLVPSLTNSASVSAAEHDSDPDNNTASVTLGDTSLELTGERRLDLR